MKQYYLKLDPDCVTMTRAMTRATTKTFYKAYKQ